MQPTLFGRSRLEVQCAERGAALVELVIVVPLFVGMIYASLYLTELGLFKLEAQEVARYSAWTLAMRSFSDFSGFDHAAKTLRAADDVRSEVDQVYRDLDAARETLQLMPGRTGSTQSAVLLPVGPNELVSRPVALLPAALSANLPIPGPSMLPALLGLSGGTQGLLTGVVTRLGLHQRGEVHAKVNVITNPPLRPRDAARARAMAAAGRLRHFDLSAWNPLARRIRDQDATGQRRDIQTVLIADPWRLFAGVTAHPAHNGDFVRVVSRVRSRAFEALPGGIALQSLLRVNGYTEKIPADLRSALGLPVNEAGAVVFARPYTQDRSGPPPGKTDAERRAGAGYVHIFSDTGSRVGHEPAAVRNFETLPLYDRFGGDGALLRTLNSRGANFLGCPHSQQRRCRR